MVELSKIIIAVNDIGFTMGYFVTLSDHIKILLINLNKYTIEITICFHDKKNIRYHCQIRNETEYLYEYEITENDDIPYLLTKCEELIEEGKENVIE